MSGLVYNRHCILATFGTSTASAAAAETSTVIQPAANAWQFENGM